MSNIQIDLYEASIDRLARTIVLKDEDAALAINRAMIEKRFQVNPADPTTWKYYLNLNGQYHASDVEMTVVSLDTQELIKFNKENLQIHLATKREYYYGSEYYQALVSQYPDQENLIRRILNPIDLQTAIDAPAGTILYFEAGEVESAETNLIPKLQQWIQNQLRRWDIVGYRKTDELFATALFGVIYAFIPAVIKMLRRENCHTYHAHSFHIWNYLDSHGRLSQYRRFLTTKQALWLYRNIRWVYKNAGRTHTFEQLMQVILSDRNIPLGKYDYEPDVSSIGSQLRSLSSAVDPTVIDTGTSGLYSTPRLLRTPLNLVNLQPPEPVFKTIVEITERQIPLARDNALFVEESINTTTASLTTSALTQLPIKTYESEMVDLSDQKPYTFYDTLLNHWLDLGTTARYTAIISVTNPFTGDVMSMSAREAFAVWLYAFNKLNGITFSEIPRVVAIRTLRRKVPTFAQLRRMSSKRFVSDSLIREFIADQVSVGTIIATESFYKKCNEIHQTLLRHNKVVAFQSHYRARGEVEKVMLSFYGNHLRTISDDPGQTFEDFFSARGWQISTLRDFDLEILQKNVFERITGIDTQAIISLKDLQSAMLRLMSNLGTYAVHYLQSINEAPALVLNPIQVRVGDFKTRMASTAHFDAAIGIKTVKTKVRQKAYTTPLMALTLSTGVATASAARIPMIVGLMVRGTGGPTSYYNSAPIGVKTAEFVGGTQTIPI